MKVLYDLHILFQGHRIMKCTYGVGNELSNFYHVSLGKLTIFQAPLI